MVIDQDHRAMVLRGQQWGDYDELQRAVKRLGCAIAMGGKEGYTRKQELLQAIQNIAEEMKG